MPVQSCTLNGKPGYQYGDSGRCYTYTRGDDTGKKRAKRKAHLQGAAVEANGSSRKSVKETEDISEYDDSLNDYIDLIRREFDKAFPYVYAPDKDETSYYYVIDVFEDYLVCKSGTKHYEVGFTESEDDITFDPKDKWVPVKLTYVQEMMTGHFRDVMFISEFKGSYPDVKVFSDIDIKELTGGEENPVFATLPIGKANVISGNNRFYDEAFLQEQEKQVREKRPIGIMGHLPKEQRSTAFPAEAVHWVGALRVNEILWGKGYFPQGEPRDRLQRYRATKKKIATSIDATADGVWDPKMGAYHMIAETLDLSQIDIAPSDRAGVKDLSAVPHITQEMADSSSSSYTVVVPKEDEMGKEEVIRELRAEDAALLPESVKSSIVSQYSEEIRKSLGLPEGTSLTSAIQEMNKQKKETAEKAVSLRVTELIGDPEKGIKIPSIQTTVQELVMAKNPATPEDAERIYGEVVQTAHVQELLKLSVQQAMGPSSKTPVPSQSTEASATGKYFVPGNKSN